MGRLRQTSGAREFVLRARTLVGRGMRNDVCLSGRGASSEHAIIAWDGTGWTLRDLTSRNGTFVNDTLILKREWTLQQGDEIVFGDPDDRWHLASCEAPEAQAVRHDGMELVASEGVLVLPTNDGRAGLVFQMDDAWQLELDGELRDVQDGERLTLGEHRYLLCLPCPDPQVQRTRTTRVAPPLATARIHLRSSLDGESVRVTIELAGKSVVLSERSCLYALLVLAQLRLDEAGDGIPADEAGWTYSDDLARQLGVTPLKLNTDVHRLRRMVRDTHLFHDPDLIIERRRATGQLRIGGATLVVEGGHRASRPDGSSRR